MTQQELRTGKAVLEPVSGGQIHIGGHGQGWNDWMGRQAYKYRIASKKGRTQPE